MKKLVKLNLARNCLKYIIEIYGIKEIYIPYFTCPVVWIAAKEEGCKINFYHINNSFMPEREFQKDDYILYTNYFGLCGKNCRNLSEKYKNLIVDNSQSFYTPPSGLANFNSLRKFFPVTNGAYLYIDKISNTKIEQDKLHLEVVNIQTDFEKFVRNELMLNNEKQIKIMSNEVESIMQTIDFEKDKNQRIKYFKSYKKIFGQYNRIKLSLSDGDIPYCYPFSTNNEDIKEKIRKSKLNILQLWKNFPARVKESEFLNDTLAFPLTDDISKLTDILSACS